MQSICDEDVCGKCYEEELEQFKFDAYVTIWPREAVEMYFAAHLTHGNLERYHKKGFNV